ncbi:monofunctional biosynthetic peptidoglycan transglycosylase [Thiocystis violacea]|uniref:monofunctional biosynthetic peptidoglycan transglycosylase n=1 Tax=Thiocystis violacea TaxID=13725 RepID=UPI001903F610|nr:monofunctional biosynthetic peptidoglycan transglycosylase [Thiocystis violacea]MBK1723638.1 monofunctional biosynthetic peptidoglycan transglycosylase [Thiocystis violacea]
MTEIGASGGHEDLVPPCSPSIEHPASTPALGGPDAIDQPFAGLAEPAGVRRWLGGLDAARLASRLWRWALGVAIFCVLSSAALVIVLRWVDPPASAFMLQHALNLRQFDQPPPYYQHAWIPWKRIPNSIRLAAIAGEDQRFPSHLGLDLIEIRHALSAYLSGGRLRGASTITQQTAKNLFLWPGSGWGRKLAEGWLTLLMEVLWPKERILEVYLNIAQFSPRTYGIESTSQRFFQHSASELTPDESALMIAVLPAPGNYSLEHPSERLQRRAAWIRDQTRRLGGTRYLDRL